MESKNLSLLNERIAFLDYIRVIACLLVMVIHTCSRFLIGGQVSLIANNDIRLWLSVYDGFVLNASYQFRDVYGK